MGADLTPPPPYPKISELPPPGNERRRLLRQYGINITEYDFTPEELAARRVRTDPNSGAHR